MARTWHKQVLETNLEVVRLHITRIHEDMQEITANTFPIGHEDEVVMMTRYLEKVRTLSTVLRQMRSNSL